METEEAELTPVKTSRGISWLGGALFGRSPRPDDAPRPLFGLAGTWQLIVLDAAMAGVCFKQAEMGPWLTLAAGVTVAGLTLLWIRRYGKTTLPAYRRIAWVISAFALVHGVDLLARPFLHR
jgi:hypothetical protein